MATMDYLSILTATDGRKATKIFAETEFGLSATDWNNPTFFDYQAVPVSSLDELSKLLSELEPRADQLIIRGGLREGREPKALRRTSAAPTANFEPIPRRWLCIDVDSFPMPDRYGGAWDANEEAIIDDVCRQLPKEFHGVSCHWQFSSSMGIKPGVRVHLWFWLSRPVSDEEAKAWLRLSKTPVDLSLYNPVQVHYTAAPIFNEPAKDPDVRP